MAERMERRPIGQPATLREAPEAPKEEPKPETTPTLSSAPPASPAPAQENPSTQDKGTPPPDNANQEKAAPPKAVKPSLVVDESQIKAGTRLPVVVVNGQVEQPAMWTVQYPNETRSFYRASPQDFSVALDSSGKYRVTLRQPNDEGEMREVASHSFEVV